MPGPELAERPRLASLDAFRGLDIALMLMVNAIRGSAEFPRHLSHAYLRDPMSGATLADMVFPWFLLMVGVSIPFSMQSGRGRAAGPGRRLAMAARRSAILYALGCVLHAAKTAPTEPLTWKIVLTSNILTHIALAYFIAAALYHAPRWGRLAFLAAVLIGKWVLLRHVNYPGLDHPMWTAEQNMLEYLRQRAGPAVGLLTVLSGSTLTVIGSLAGDYLRSDGGAPTARKAGWLVGAGAALAAVSWGWRFDFPYSKMNFTSTYALLAAGTGLAVLGGMYWLIDVRRVTTAWVLRVLGMNSIAVYFTVEMLWPLVLLLWLVRAPGGGAAPLADVGALWLAPLFGRAAALWLVLIGYLVLVWLGAWWLYRRRIFVRV